MDLKLIEKYYRGTCTPEEVEEVLRWFQSDEPTREQEDRLAVWWDQYSEPLTGVSSNHDLLSDIHRRIRPDRTPERLLKEHHADFSKTTRPWTYWIRVAAVLVFTLLVAFLIGYYTPNKNAVEKSIELVLKENPKGIKTTIMLPDGTKVSLNSESRIRYPEIFASDERVVYLEGEAFFDVTENPIKPFKVRTGNLETTALGTAFNVKSYRDEPSVKVSLVTGKVLVMDLSTGQSGTMLLPGEQAQWSPEEETITKKSFDVKSATGWKDGWIVFRNASLEEVSETLERWYGVKIEVETNDLAFKNHWNYTGEYQDETLDDVLKGIGYVKSFSFEINGKNVKIITDN